jgi:hypothetical protein
VGDFGAHTADEVGEMVAARRAVAAQQLGGRGAEQRGKLVQPSEAGTRAALLPITDRGDGDAEPVGDIGLAEPLCPAQPRETVAEHFEAGVAVQGGVDQRLSPYRHQGATFTKLSAARLSTSH